jgi:hypothetical protein
MFAAIVEIEPFYYQHFYMKTDHILSNRLKFWIVIVLIIIIILLLKTCSHGIKLIKRAPGQFKKETAFLVPPDATFILSFNLKNILPEIGFDQLKTTQPYLAKLSAAHATNPVFTNVFKDPVLCGINMDKKALFYIDVGDNDEETYSASVLCLRDAAKLVANVKASSPTKIIKEKHYEYALLGNNNAMAWSPDFVMFVTTNPELDVKSIFEEVFTIEAEKYFDKSPEYIDFFDKSVADGCFWVDMTSYARNQIHATGKPGEFNQQLLKGNVIFGDVNFETGYFETDIQFKLNSLLSEGLKGFFKNDKDRTITQYIPLDNPSFVANLSLNIDGLFSFLLKDTDRKVEARNSLAEYGLLIEDFGKALTGDVLLAGFPNDTTSKSSVLFGLKIKDSEYFFKLLKVMEDVGQIEMIENNLYKMNQGVVPFYPLLATYEDKLQRLIIKDGYAFVSLDRRVIDAMKISSIQGKEVPPYLLPLNDQYNYFSFYGNELFGETNQYSEKFSVRDYSLNYNGTILKLKCNLKNNQVSSLKQMLNL